MSSPSRPEQDRIKPVSKIIDYKLDGVPLGLTPVQAELLEALLKGPISLECSVRNKRSTAVLICQMRRILHDLGFPLTIRRLQGKRDGSYVLE